MTIFSAMTVNLLWYGLFGAARSFVIENTGTAITRGNPTPYDIEKLQQMRRVWREPLLRIVAGLIAFSIFLLVPYLIYRDWLVVGIAELVFMFFGSLIGLLGYRMSAVNNIALQAIAPIICLVALYFVFAR